MRAHIHPYSRTSLRPGMPHFPSFLFPEERPVSITINPNLNLNPTNFLPIDAMSNTVNAGVNAAQSGIMQSLSQLFSMLSQLFASGLQNSQFNTNPLSSTLGNTLGNSLNNGLGNLTLSGLQNPQLGSGPINISLANGNGQSFSPALQNPQLGSGPITITINNNSGNPASIGTDRSIATGGCQSQQPMSTERAAQVLNQNFDKLSGGAETFNRDDLQRVANDPNSSPELRRAARFVLDNPQVMSALDTADKRCNAAADGRISLGDLTAAGGAVQPQSAMTADRAAEVLNKNFDNVSGGKETVDRNDLRRVLNDPNSSPELKQAASFLLNNPAAYRKIETADAWAQGGTSIPDGRISKGDTVAAMSSSGSPSAQESKAAATLYANKDTLLAGDKLISREELGQIATTGKLLNGQPASADLVAAAQYYTQNPEKFSKLEDTNFYRNPGSKNIAKGDGKIGEDDLRLAAAAA